MSHLGKQYKVIIIGDGAVGKTSILTRYLQNHFDANTKLTVGASVKFQQITNKQLYEDAGIKDGFSGITELGDLNTDNIFHFWDLGGQRMFDQLRPSYFQGTDGIVLCFDLTDKKTLIGDQKTDRSEDHSIGRFLLQLIKYFGRNDVKNIPILLLGTKSDLTIDISDKEIEMVIKMLFDAGLNVISYREDDLEGLKIYGNYSVGSDLYERSDANQWVKTSALTGINARLAFKIIEVAVKQQQLSNEDERRNAAHRRDDVPRRRRL